MPALSFAIHTILCCHNRLILPIGCYYSVHVHDVVIDFFLFTNFDDVLHFKMSTIATSYITSTGVKTQTKSWYLYMAVKKMPG